MCVLYLGLCMAARSLNYALGLSGCYTVHMLLLEAYTNIICLSVAALHCFSLWLVGAGRFASSTSSPYHAVVDHSSEPWVSGLSRVQLRRQRNTL